MWDLISDSPMSVAVHWLMQGFPHPHFQRLSPQVRSYFPFPQLVQSADGNSSGRSSGATLAESSQRALAGNAMHWGSCAAAFLFALGCTQKSLPAQAPTAQAFSACSDVEVE